MAGSSQTVPLSVLPNFVPSALVSNGVASACTRAPSARRTSSTPAVMLPHWSLPPNCSVQPYERKSSR